MLLGEERETVSAFLIHTHVSDDDDENLMHVFFANALAPNIKQILVTSEGLTVELDDDDDVCSFFRLCI